MKPCFKCQTLTSNYTLKTSNRYIICDNCDPITYNLLYQLYVIEDLGFKLVAEKLKDSYNIKTNKSALQNRLKKFNIQKRDPNKKYTVEESVLRDFYEKQEKTVEEIALILNIPEDSLNYYIFQKFNLQRTDEQKKRITKKAAEKRLGKTIATPTHSELHDLAIVQNKSRKEIAKYYNVNPTTAKRWLHDVKIYKPLDLQVEANQKTYKINRNIPEITKEQLHFYFIVKNWTYKKIAYFFKVSWVHIRNLLVKYELTGIKTITEIASSFQKSTSGCRKDVGLARSTWEANLKRLLQHLKIPYEYESTKFTFVSTESVKLMNYKDMSYFKEGITYSYIPDFKILTKEPFYLEVKGFLTDTARYKMSKIQTDLPIYMLERPLYKELHKQFKFLEMWETPLNNFASNPIKFLNSESILDIQKNCSTELKNLDEIQQKYNLLLGKNLN